MQTEGERSFLCKYELNLRQIENNWIKLLAQEIVKGLGASARLLL